MIDDKQMHFSIVTTIKEELRPTLHKKILIGIYRLIHEFKSQKILSWEWRRQCSGPQKVKTTQEQDGYLWIQLEILPQ